MPSTLPRGSNCLPIVSCCHTLSTSKCPTSHTPCLSTIPLAAFAPMETLMLTVMPTSWGKNGCMAQMHRRSCAPCHTVRPLHCVSPPSSGSWTSVLLDGHHRPQSIRRYSFVPFDTLPILSHTAQGRSRETLGEDISTLTVPVFQTPTGPFKFAKSIQHTFGHLPTDILRCIHQVRTVHRKIVAPSSKTSKQRHIINHAWSQ